LYRCRLRDALAVRPGLTGTELLREGLALAKRAHERHCRLLSSHKSPEHTLRYRTPVLIPPSPGRAPEHEPLGLHIPDQAAVNLSRELNRLTGEWTQALAADQGLHPDALFKGLVDDH